MEQKKRINVTSSELGRDVSHHALESGCLGPIAPHKLGQVGLQVFPSHALHRLDSGLVLGPIALHVLSVDASVRVDEVVRVVDVSMSEPKRCWILL